MDKYSATKNSRYKIGLARLHSARAGLSATAFLLAMIIVIEPYLIWLCLGGFVIILLATFVATRSRNVSKLRQMVERRRQRIWPRNAMKSITEALDIPVFILDRASVLRYANSASEDIFGTTNLGDPLSFKFRTPQIVRLVEDTIENAKRQSMVYEEQVTTKRWFAVECIPVPKFRNRDDRLQSSNFFLLTFTDLTQIRQTEQMRSDFVANASHELRTPLASLRGYIETLQGPAKNDKKARDEFLKVMLEQAERMSRLIDDLLSLSRIEMKAYMPPRDKVDLAEILKSVKDALEPSAKQYGARLKFSGTGSPMLIVGDHDELIQVFHNLVENACKYGRKNGTVNVILNRQDNTPDGTKVISVEVCDDGPGIAREHIPRLTERFYRAQSNNTSAPKGTGLGLAIVKHIVNRHRASLNIVSEPGKGTTVKISFQE